MRVDIAISRPSLVLLLTALIASLVLHLNYLPFWFYLIATFVFGWRLGIYLGYFSFPGRWAKALAVIASSIMVYQLNAGQMSLEGSSSFLVAAALLKVLEMAQRRDAIVMVFLSFVLQAAGFLFEQGILAALMGMLTLCLATMAMVSIQGSDYTGVPKGLPVFKNTLSLMLLALPFMLVLYFLFPRLGPLWAVPFQAQSGMTGLSTRMAPGDIASLSQSDALAFRATFSSKLPPRENLYWRAMVLDEYDGRAWNVSERKIGVYWYANDQGLLQSLEDTYQYEIIQEPTGQRFLFSLAGAMSQTPDTGVTRQGLMIAAEPVYQRIRYQAASIGHLEGYGLEQVDRGFYLSLPVNANPQTKEWAKDLRSRHSNSPEQSTLIANDIIRYFSEQAFYYTLKPPVYGRADIDEFLFGERRGFCAHYASAMTFALRSAGVPARVVTGYQGGEWHPDGYLMVRQYDAHAWVELWNGREWVAYDPTAAVAPDRIDYGLEQAMIEEGSFLSESLLSPHKFKGVSWLNQLRLEWDNLNYYWSRWVLSYDTDKQSQLLSRWFSISQFAEALYAIAASLIGLFLVASIFLWWTQRPIKRPAVIEGWNRLRQKARKSGLELEEGEPPKAVLNKIADNWPDLSTEASLVTSLMRQHLYANQLDDDKVLVRAMRKLQRRIRPKKK